MKKREETIVCILFKEKKLDYNSIYVINFPIFPDQTGEGVEEKIGY